MTIANVLALQEPDIHECHDSDSAAAVFQDMTDLRIDCMLVAGTRPPRYVTKGQIAQYLTSQTLNTPVGQPIAAIIDLVIPRMPGAVDQTIDGMGRPWEPKGCRAD